MSICECICVYVCTCMPKCTYTPGFLTQSLEDYSQVGVRRLVGCYDAAQGAVCSIERV